MILYSSTQKSYFSSTFSQQLTGIVQHLGNSLVCGEKTNFQKLPGVILQKQK